MIVDDFIRRYDAPRGLVHVSGLREAVCRGRDPLEMDGSYSALCTYGDVVHLRGAVTKENVTCLRCVKWISFEVRDE